MSDFTSQVHEKLNSNPGMSWAEAAGQVRN